MTPGRECRHPIPERASKCPSCGAPQPDKAARDGWRHENKSRAAIAGYAVAQFAAADPLVDQIGVHVAEGRGQTVFRLPELLGIA